MNMMRFGNSGIITKIKSLSYITSTPKKILGKDLGIFGPRKENSCKFEGSDILLDGPADAKIGKDDPSGYFLIEDTFYNDILRLGPLHLYQLFGGGGYRRGGDGCGGGEREGGVCYRISIVFCVVRGKLDSTADSHSDTEGRTWNDNVIWVKGNWLQSDDEELLDLQFRTVKQSVKSTVERKKSLLDEVVEEEIELELVLEGLGLSRKSRLIVSRTREVEERARLAAHHGEEDTSKMVTRLVKRIWLSIEQGKSKLKKAKNEHENELARAKIEAMKEVRMGHHLMVKCYSGEEVNAIKTDTYVEEEDEEEAEAVGVVDGMKEANENKEDQYVKAHLRLEKLNQAISEQTLQVEEKDSEIKKGLEELSEATKRAKKL
ncbi:hypothetical protein GIB67_014752 [Kingdonia uniflora]|uniref:Uncharacterized protein n=1 Tax=Kingdonia uniflora TaxID=39325 RepID=A0A7J7NUP9_9MAGN|nr:hypothetical protein GIB67_014752 [Kingdonia uniflora]